MLTDMDGQQPKAAFPYTQRLLFIEFQARMQGDKIVRRAGSANICWKGKFRFL